MEPAVSFGCFPKLLVAVLARVKRTRQELPEHHQRSCRARRVWQLSDCRYELLSVKKAGIVDQVMLDIGQYRDLRRGLARLLDANSTGVTSRASVRRRATGSCRLPMLDCETGCADPIIAKTGDCTAP